MAHCVYSRTRVQGDDEKAGKFLRSLDNDLQKAGAKHDIVDTITAEKMKGMSFVELISKSLAD